MRESVISDYVGWKLCDAIAKLYQDAMTVLVPTENLYDILTHTEDEDVETAMLVPAEACDLDMAGGITLSSIWDGLIDALITQVTEEGVSGGGFASLDAYQGIGLTTGRHYRMSRDFANPHRTNDGATAIGVAGIFPLPTLLGSFAHGGAFGAGTALALSLEGAARVVAEVTSGIGAASWLVNVVCVDSGPASGLAADIDAAESTITVGNTSDFPVAGTVQIDDELITITNTGRTGEVLCTDATRGVGGTTAAIHAADAWVRLSVTRTLTMPSTMGVGGRVDALRGAVTGTARSGQAVIPVSNPSAAGFAAGQQVLLKDDTYPRKLTVDLAFGASYYGYGTQIPVEDTWPYDVGDTIVMHDDTWGDNTYVVYKVDRPNKIITVTTTIMHAYTTGARAHIRLATAEGRDRGNNEVAVIDSVDDAADTITLEANLRNTYYMSGYVYLLVAKVLGATTSSGGQGGDAVAIRALPDRTIYK